MVSVGSIGVHLLEEGSDQPVRLEVSSSLAVALAIGASVHDGDRRFDLDFKSAFVGVLSAPDPLSAWLRKYFQELEVALPLLAAIHPSVPQDPTPWSSPFKPTVSVRTALAEAERLRSDASGPELPVDIRHVVAAYIALPNYHEGDFRQFGIDRPKWARAFAAEAIQMYPSESRFWEAFPDRAFPETGPTAKSGAAAIADTRATLYGFAPDVYSQHDLLGIEREVNGLASLIASHKTSVPLSIGLFGKWGSGKTFFIRHLQRRIREICTKAAESGKAQAEVAYFKHVAQIEFNAWHYSEGTLIASLVEHILQNLRTTDEESEQQVAARRELILTNLIEGRQQETAAEDKVKAAQEKIDAKQTEIDGLKNRQQDERKKIANNLSSWAVLDTARAAIALDPDTDAAARQTLQKLGITEVSAAARDVQTTLARARDELAGIGGILLPLIRGDEQRTRVLWLLFVVAVPIAAGALLYEVLQSQSPFWATLAAWATRVAAFLALGKKWLDTQLSWVAARRKELEQAKSMVDRSIEQQARDLQAKQARELAEQFDELERLRTEHAAALRERDERARERGELETALARTSTSFLLNEFIMDRASAKDYRQLLGFMALVRRDFDKLSALIERSNRRILGGDGNAASEIDPRLNRIVLYIDDLDRCPEDRVAEVLRAVHLLLAFPLFVVVVAVDSRWLTRCLRDRYPKIFGATDNGDGETSATPMDYLEKIFQIPLWLQPLSPDQRVAMVRSLLRDPERETADTKLLLDGDQPQQRPDEGSEVRRDAEPVRGEAIQTSETQLSNVGGQPQPQAPRQAPEPPRPPTIDLDPPALMVSDEEWAFIEDLGALLSYTPRALKRFANTYRLVKGALPEHEVRQFVSAERDAPYRFCLFHLAVLVSLPSFAPAYLRAMRDLTEEETKTIEEWQHELSVVFAPGDGPRPENWDDWALLQEHLGALSDEGWGRSSVSAFAAWAPRVARYTFTPD
jgi:hypothetical protein